MAIHANHTAKVHLGFDRDQLEKSNNPMYLFFY